MAAHRGLDWKAIIALAAELAYIEAAALGVPPTLRRVHYLLVMDALAQAAGYTNTENDYKYFGSKTAKMRDAGTFPVLTDRTRRLTWLPPSESDPAKVLRNHADLFVSDRWATQPVGVMIAVEKDGLVPLLESRFYDLGVPITALKGHVSQGHLVKVRQALDELSLAGDRPVKVIYAGDYDPSGLHILDDFENRLAMPDVTVERLALNRLQVAEYALPPLPAKTSDSRRQAMEDREGVAMQVELDALDPAVLLGLFTDAIDAVADPDKWWEQIDAESATADSLRAAAEQLQRSS